MFITALFAFFLIFSLLLLFWVSTSFFGFMVTRVPFVPTAARDIRAIATRVPLGEDDVIYDLGSGNGKVVFMLERLTGAQTVGFEAMLWTHWYARGKQVLYNIGNRRSRARFILGNFFKHDWSAATVVYCYLFPPLMRQVGEKILAECKPGTRVIVRDFPIPNLPQVDHFQTYGRHEIFIYKV